MKIKAFFWVLAAGILSQGCAWAESVAMVTDTRGSVFIVSGAAKEKVALLAYLEAGMTLQLESNASLSATFFSQPVEYRFSGPARLKVEQDKITSVDGKAETRTVSLQKTSAAKKFTVAQRERVTQAAFEMRAIRPGLRLDDPVDTKLMDVDALNFNWDGPRPIEAYRLSIYAKSGQLLHQESLTVNVWIPPANLLKAGNSYKWEVKAALENGEVLSALGGFSVADPATVEMILAQRPQPAASYSERVLYAVFLEGQGFNYDARRLWRTLAKEHPDDLVARERSMR